MRGVMGGVGIWLVLLVTAGPAGLGADVPARLTPHEFWQLVTELSEPNGAFISDNLVSNEKSFAQVVPQLAAWKRTGDVYLGVGPEQNFTYLATTQARMGFILDIRRENLLLHLMYKAIFELSPDRATFASRLFSRPKPDQLGTSPSAQVLMQAFAGPASATDTTFQRNVADVRRVLLQTFQFPLVEADLVAIEGLYRRFHEYGSDLAYGTTMHGQPGGLASYAQLMSQVDSDGRPISYLGTDRAYQFVRSLQQRNLVVPVVGNFAGAKALRSIGAYLTSHSATVGAFYLSNVEDYLGREKIPKNGEWDVFCANVATLPIDEGSIFIRPLGFAAFDLEGRWMISSAMHILSTDRVVTHAVGVRPELPSALHPIAPEVRSCAAK